MIISFLNNIINRYNSTLKDDNGITAPTEKQILKLLKREKFSSYFPVRAYDPIENCYYNADGTVGFIWEVTPVAYASASLYDTIAHIIKSMPQKCVFQTILHADNDIDPILHRYLSIHKKDPAGLCAKTALLFKNASVHGFKTMARIPARNFRCFVAIKTPNDEDAFDEIELLSFPVTYTPFEMLKTSYRGDTFVKDLLEKENKIVAEEEEEDDDDEE